MSMVASTPLPTDSVSGSVALTEKRSFLESGAAWPGEPRPDCIETHASFVYLTRDRAWKIKKPVRLMHVDQRSLEARAHLCNEEVRLNRQLAGSVYRGVVPLVQRSDGALALGGAGRVVDWIVEMERLPASSMLHHRLKTGPAPILAEIINVSDRMVTFYRRQHEDAAAGPRYYDRLLRESRTNAAHLREMQEYLGNPLREDVLDFVLPALADCRDEIISRADQGLLSEGHGDLRTEHVCLTDPPIIFHRVEFDHDIRLVDPVAEFNALGIESAFAGAGWIRAILLLRLSQTIPPPSRALLTVYGVINCLTRARLAIDHLRDAEIRTPAKWPARATLYQAAAIGLIESFRTG